jgi:integrase
MTYFIASSSSRPPDGHAVRRTASHEIDRSTPEISPHLGGARPASLIARWSPHPPARFSQWFQQHVVAAGLPRITLHGLRHSYATAALKAGVPVKVISERLGHATVATWRSKG